MMSLLLTATLLLQVPAPEACREPHPAICAARSLRHAGDLDEAASVIEDALVIPGNSAEARAMLHLEMARVLDRIGLHQNSRPVEESLEHVLLAERLLRNNLQALAASVELEKAVYQYQAEMEAREFINTGGYARRALAQFERIGDLHGQADAVHRLGLVHMQRREFDDARVLFDRSLELDNEGGSRHILRGDYERHVGFLHFLAGDVAAAVPYFERSLRFRREGGLLDQSMFAGETYASALLDVGRVDDAVEPILYALMIAKKIDSPVATSRIGLTLGKLYEKQGDVSAALEAYEMTVRAAESVGYSSVVDRAHGAIQRLRSGDGRLED